jgi:acyl-CoA synthetase (AMP-forming)/AMP-acid ligase II
MHIDFLIKIFQENKDRVAIIWKEKSFSYEWLANRIDYWEDEFKRLYIEPGEIVALIGDFSPECISIMLALIENANIIVPLNNFSKENLSNKLSISQSEKIIYVDDSDIITHNNLNIKAVHNYYSDLREKKVAGLVLFTSGTSGVPKAAVHNFPKLLEKYKTPRKALKTINFLMFDHWGGLNTMIHTLSNVGIVLATKDRSPDAVCAFIEKHKIELLPASPTFFNLLIISSAYINYNMSSLKIISYGTEPMPMNTLLKLKEIFPLVKLQQTYGLIELGVLRSKSMSNDSLWVKVGGDGYQIRIINGILQIKAESAMLGYLNAASPFTDDGWFITGDSVEVKGEYIKILGRKSEMINVGGEKVYPQEIENIILELENVKEATVYGEKNPIIGNIVCVKITLMRPEEKKIFINRLKKYCTSKLKSYMVPVKVLIQEGDQYTERYKKLRN